MLEKCKRHYSTYKILSVRKIKRRRFTLVSSSDSSESLLKITTVAAPVKIIHVDVISFIVTCSESNHDEKNTFATMLRHDSGASIEAAA